MAATIRLSVEPRMLEWACDRSGKPREELREKFPKLDDWLAESSPPTLAELKRFAAATYTAFGHFFDDEPPSDALPIADLRYGPDARNAPPSPHLLDTIRDCQFGQLWYRQRLLDDGAGPLPFVNAIDAGQSPQVVAAEYAPLAGFDKARTDAQAWENAFQATCASLRGLGVLVFINGVVGTNTHRPLDPAEFRGFALSDQIAPLIFVNGGDAKAAQMFTLAHEFAHLLLGDTGLDDLPATSDSSNAREQWCDAVAVEMLVPLDDLRPRFRRDGTPLSEEVVRIARHYKVSRLVLLRRLRTAGLIEADEYRQLYVAFYSQYSKRPRSPGGDFYRTLLARYGHGYVATVVASTLAGTTSYTDMTALLGFKKLEVLDNLASKLELAG